MNLGMGSRFHLSVCRGLIKANKDLDLLVRPGLGHSAGNDEYDIRKRKDFFVKHLMEVTPPAWDEVHNPDLLAQKGGEG